MSTINTIYIFYNYISVGGMVALWLKRSTPEWAVCVQALAGDIVLCSWARHFTLTVPPSTQVYKWVPANCWGNLTICGKVTCDGLASCPGEVEILLAASRYRNRDKLRQLWASWLQGFTFRTYLATNKHLVGFHLPMWFWSVVCYFNGNLINIVKNIQD